MCNHLCCDRWIPAAEGRLTLNAVASRMAISMEANTAPASPQADLQSGACIAHGFKSLWPLLILDIEFLIPHPLPSWERGVAFEGTGRTRDTVTTHPAVGLEDSDQVPAAAASLQWSRNFTPSSSCIHQ